MSTDTSFLNILCNLSITWLFQIYFLVPSSLIFLDANDLLDVLSRSQVRMARKGSCMLFEYLFGAMAERLKALVC